MYTNDNLDIIEDGQAFTHANGVKYPSNYPKNEIVGLYPVTLTAQPTGDIVITGFHIELIDGVYTQVWDYRAKTTDELTAEKQSLLDSIEPLQHTAFNKSDAWVAKYNRKVDLKTLKGTPKKECDKTTYKQVLEWAEEVEECNDNITIANTKAEIQARVDRINSLIETFPEFTEEDED